MITSETKTDDSDSSFDDATRKNVANRKNKRESLTVLLWIMAGVLIWGTFHAIGVYVSAREPNILKPIILYGCVLGFLGFWAIMLWYRSSHAN